MTPEQKFAQWVREAMQPCDWQRVESIGSGIPDVNLCVQGLDVWIELKVYTGGRTLLRKEQVAWGIRRAIHGGNVGVASLHPSGEIHFWKFPDVNVIPYSKYCQITTCPFIVVRDKQQFRSFLIASFNSGLLDLIKGT